MTGEILIVEDEKDTVELLCYNLGREGYKTAVAMDGSSALELFKKTKPDLVLLDVMLPQPGGRELCRIFRSINESVPILMVTALGSEDDRLKGLDLGADDYISKPFSVRELMMKVKRHAGRELNYKKMQTRLGEGDERVRYMVHELKNSLMSLEGFSDLAEKKGNGSTYLPYIQSSARHMNDILDNLSLISFLEKGNKLKTCNSIDMLAEIKSTVQMSREKANKKGVELSILNDTQTKVEGDKTAVRQVLLNILSNGIKYNNENGKVMIFFEEAGDFLEVYVSDTGVGIAAEELDRIFEKDYRACGSEKISGSGFGLYLSKLIMSAIGGKISVSSQKDGGTLFVLAFRKGVKVQEELSDPATCQ